MVDGLAGVVEAQLGADAMDAPAPPVPQPDDKPDDDDGKPDKQKHKRPGRNKRPEHLKRNEIELKVPEDQRSCTVCGAQKVCIGHEESEVPNDVPGHFEVDHIKRENLACKQCAEGVVVAPPATKLQGGSLCGPGLLAHAWRDRQAAAMAKAPPDPGPVPDGNVADVN